MYKRGQVNVIFFDLSKAFDIVEQNVLLSKLSRYGACGSVHHWLKNYLSRREYLVPTKGKRSRTYDVTFGVLHGSVLGRFSIFVNEVSKVAINSSVLQYADNIKTFCEVRSDGDCVMLQADVCALGNWCLTNNFF